MKVTSCPPGRRDDAISPAPPLAHACLQPLTSQDNALCTILWIIRVNMLVSACPAVDDRGCGNVDNRGGAQSCQVAGLRGRLLKGPGLLADLTLSDQRRTDLWLVGLARAPVGDRAVFPEFGRHGRCLLRRPVAGRREPPRASIPVPIRLISVGRCLPLTFSQSVGRCARDAIWTRPPGRMVTEPARRRSIRHRAGKDANRHLSRATGGAHSPVTRRGQWADGACTLA